ncbi:hypothetical protein B0H14DRAFT_2801768, partial [Mycena olivaceomarginata]
LKGFGEYGTRMTPNGHADIEKCYNGLDAYESRSPGIKALKASSWNTELASYAVRFTFRREEVAFALSMRTVVTAEELNSNMVEIFSTMLSPPERDMKDWISYNGGGEAVLESHWKCAAMLSRTTSKPRQSCTQEGLGFKETNAIAALRKEYRENIQSSVIEANLEMYYKRFEMTLDDLVRELAERNTMQHQDSAVLPPTPQIGPGTR